MQDCQTPLTVAGPRPMPAGGTPVTLPDAGPVLPASQVAELLRSLVKALRAFQIYLPNNPVYQRAVQQLAAAFAPVWAATDELVLRVVETDFVWEEQVVYHQLSKSESVAWMLYKDGLRVLTLKRGVEEGEIERFLELVNRARLLATDAPDDLLTLLWEEEFQCIDYRLRRDLLRRRRCSIPRAPTWPSAGPSGAAGGGGGGPPERPQGRRWTWTSSIPPSTSSRKRDRYIVQRGAAGVHPRRPRQRALDALRHLRDAAVRRRSGRRLSAIVDALFPNLLNQGEFRVVAAVLREFRGLSARRATCRPRRGRSCGLPARLSEPTIVSQLLQSLDEAASPPERRGRERGAGRAAPRGAGDVLALLPALQAPKVRTILETRGGPAGRGRTRRSAPAAAAARVGTDCRGDHRCLRAASTSRSPCPDSGRAVARRRRGAPGGRGRAGADRVARRARAHRPRDGRRGARGADRGGEARRGARIQGRAPAHRGGGAGQEPA